MIAGAEFRQDESKSPSGNQRLGHIEVEKTPLVHLGSAELSVLDMVLAEFGALGQVDLLDRVHALPEVKQAEMKSEIALPMGGRHRSKDYLAELLSEIEREQAAGIHEAEFNEDESESRERAREALTTARAL
jgi:hypothetical protein